MTAKRAKKLGKPTIRGPEADLICAETKAVWQKQFEGNQTRMADAFGSGRICR